MIINNNDSGDNFHPRPVNENDLLLALAAVKPSVAQKDLHALVEWDKMYGMQTKGHVDD